MRLFAAPAPRLNEYSGLVIRCAKLTRPACRDWNVLCRDVCRRNYSLAHANLPCAHHPVLGRT